MDKFSTDFHKKIVPLIDKMYQMYQFIGMAKDTFRSFVIDGLEVYTFDEEKEVSFSDFYTKAMMEVIHQYIKDTLENKDYRVLIHFIDTLWMDADIKKSISYKKALSGLKRLNTFLDSLDFALETSEVTSLISTSPKLQAVLKTITDRDKEEVLSSDFSKYDNITGMLVEAYCVENGLSSQTEVDDINDDDLNLDDDTLFSMTEADADTDIDEAAYFSWEEEQKNVANVRVASAGDFSSMEYYYQLMREYPVLKPDEEKALILKMREGDSEAKDKLVYSNLRLVISITKKYVGRGVSFDDLFQEGLIGLTTGVTRFDLTKNVKLSTYATWWIRQAITRYIGDNGRNVRIPIHMIDKLGKFERTIRTLTVEYGRSPRASEIAKKMKLDENEVLELYSYRQDTLSLDGKVGDEEDTTLGTFVADPNGSLEKAHLSPSMAELIELAKDAGLTEKELDILLHHVAYEDVTLEQLGQKYDITRERIRQIEAKAIKKILKCRRTEGLAVYTEHPETNLEMLRRLRRQGPVRSNDTKSNVNQVLEDIREEIKKGSDTQRTIQQEAPVIEPPEESADTVVVKTTGSAAEKDNDVSSKKKKGKGRQSTATIFERVGVSPEEYYKYIEPELDDYDRSIIEKLLENPNPSSALTRAEKYSFNTTVLRRVRSMANDVKLFGEVRHGKRKIKKTIFERVGISPKDYYQYIEPRLTEKNRALIKRRDGEDLEHPDQSLVLDRSDNASYSSLIQKIKKWAVEDGLIVSSHNDDKNETIKNAEASSITASTNAPVTSEKDNHGGLENVVLDDKSNVITQNSVDVLNTTSIEEEKDGQRKKEENMAKPVQTIFEYLGISKDAYYQYIEPKLTEKDKTLVNERYGEDLEHPDRSMVLSDEQRKAFYGRLVPRMKRIAAKEGLIEPIKSKPRKKTAKVSDASPVITPTVEQICSGVVDATVSNAPTSRKEDVEKVQVKEGTVVVESLVEKDAATVEIQVEEDTVVTKPQVEDGTVVVKSSVEESVANIGHQAGDETIILEPLVETDAATVELQVEEHTVATKPQVEEGTVVTKPLVEDDIVIITPVEDDDTSLTKVPEHFSSEKDKLSTMSETQLDVYLQFLAGECVEIERRIAEKRSKLDDAISLYERRGRLLVREKELDLEIASKINSLYTDPAKEKVYKND